MTGKILAHHLDRRAYVYVRQSTAAQVFENTESTSRQYALADRARALGWPEHAIEVIDEDLGRSGASSEGRSGFTRLAQAVAAGNAGAIVAIEVSRLARSSQDWQRLLALCAVAQVLVIDEHTVYDPQSSDDKLLLDFKGTMSEAELHWLSLRMTGARRSMARRGELRMPAPTGYVWGDHGFEMDPDQAVQSAIATLFERFAIEPSAGAVVRWAHNTGFLVPSRRNFADGSFDLVWHRLGLARLIDMLHNPIYAGCYAYGRRPQKKILVGGEIRCVRPSSDPQDWPVRIEGAHRGYITWAVYMSNVSRLRDNSASSPFSGGSPRQGRALLAGIVVCGRCGRRMRPNYWGSGDEHFSYCCFGEQPSGDSVCWSVKGPPIDKVVEKLFLEICAPAEIDLCLAVEREVQSQAASLDEQWRLRLEKARYEARRAERRYMAVDPDNRVVARSLECDWEMRLREVGDIEQQYEAAKREHHVQLSAADRERIRALARDLPAIWHAPSTSLAERKTMIRHAILAVALHPVEVPQRQTLVRVQWRSGAVTDLRVDRPKRIDATRTPKAAVARIQELAAAGVRDEVIAERLNEEEIVTGHGEEWDVHAVRWARRRNAIVRTAPDQPRTVPLPDCHPDGRYSIRGAMARFQVSSNIVRGWIQRGLVAVTREDYETHRRVWWLRIDAATAKRLDAEAARSRIRSQHMTTTNPGGGLAP
jgi:DNA invertase Pin-like site-specific DNA recombinase